MTKRWKQRPPGSTWGDWGDDDELGRINLLTPEKVLEGVREVRGRHQLLPEPAARLPRRDRLEPAAVPAGPGADRGHAGQPGHLLQRPHERDGRVGDPRYVDVWADDVVTLSLQYSTQWDSLAHVGAEFDADGDGIEEAVYYNGYRAGIDLVGPKPDAAGDGGTPPLLRPPPRPGAHGVPRRAGAGRPRRPGPPPRPRLARGRPEDARGDHGGRRRRRRARRHAPAAHRVRHQGPRVEPRPGPGEDPHDVHVPRRRGTSRCWSGSADSQISALVADNYAVEGLVGRDRDESRHSFLPIHHLCLFRLGVPLGEMWYLHELASWLREHDRSRFLLTAPPLRLPGVVGSPLTPVATV